MADWLKVLQSGVARSALEKAYASLPGVGTEGEAVRVFMHVPKWGTYAALSNSADEEVLGMQVSA
jgi:hypothetical protein